MIKQVEPKEAKLLHKPEHKRAKLMQHSERRSKLAATARTLEQSCCNNQYSME